MVGRGRRTAPRGVALINALVVVAALSAVSVALMQRAQQAGQRLGDLQAADQVKMYLDAATFQVQEVLTLEEADGSAPSAVHLQQAWAEPVRNEPIDRGRVAWRISDLQGRFNLAWLQLAPEDGDDAEPALAAAIRDAFGRLVRERGLSRMQLRRLEQALIPRLGQRFTAYGRSTRPPGLPPFALEELLLVQGIDAEALRGLRPVVGTLPADAGGLNLNTVSAEVLAAFLPRQSRAALEAQLSTARPFADRESAMEWLDQHAGPEASSLLEALGTDVRSDWFAARIDAELDDLRLKRRVVLRRTGGEECCVIHSVLPESLQ